MNIQIREATREDYPAVVAVMREGNPRSHVSVEALEASAEKTRNSPKGLHLRQWVAVEGREVVGFAGVAQWAGSHHPDRYHAMLAVPPSRAQRGIGSALAEAMETHLRSRGAREVNAGAYEDRPHAVNFLTRRGFREVSREFDNVLRLDSFDPAAFRDRAGLPDGLRLVTLADFMAERGRDLALEAFRASFNAMRLDEPRTVPAEPYSTQEISEYVSHPTYFPQGLLLAVTPDGVVAGLTELWRDLTDPGVLHNGLTGTLREWRGRGLATALKLAGLEVARSVGVREVWTQNDSLNAPMLAVNRRLGFQPEPAFIQFRWGGIESEENK